jgi:hypothetical protein
MALNEFMEKFATEIDGQYSEYDVNKSVVIVPLKQNRFQAVMGSEKHENGNMLYQFTSKICLYSQKIDLKELLKNNLKYYYSRFYVDDDFIRMAATISMKKMNEEVLKEIILEVANAADEWEHKLTGLDVN